MDATLQALGGILLKAIPTIVLLIIVNLYLKWMFFNPLKEILQKRRDATEGARQAAEAALARASEKAAQIQAALRKAREEIYQEQEAARKRLVKEQASRIEEAREKSRMLIHQAREQMAQEAEAAKRELAGSAGALADQIVRMLLERKAA
jgi:F-type H+-transporting ATPase subunit b